MLFDLPTPDAPWRGFSADPAAWLLVLALAVFLRRSPVAVLLAAVVLVSPLSGLGRMLAAGQAAQLLVAMLLAGPAMAAARPVAVAWPLLPLAVVAAHVPRLAELAWFHAPSLPAIIVLLAAWCFWGRGPARLPMIALGATLAAIGAALLSAGDILYPHHIEGAAIWGLPVMLDQRLAGLVIGVGAGLPLLISGALLPRRPKT